GDNGIARDECWSLTSTVSALNRSCLSKATACCTAVQFNPERAYAARAAGDFSRSHDDFSRSHSVGRILQLRNLPAVFDGAMTELALLGLTRRHRREALVFLRQRPFDLDQIVHIAHGRNLLPENSCCIFNSRSISDRRPLQLTKLFSYNQKHNFDSQKS
ncbi:MAG: hypothetical protein AB7U20_06370, partial [Planctomycetaceae bacterium]